MVRWAFDTLEIGITKDKKQIKKAYALLVKKYHPEEQPERWSKIHEAYEAALRYADGMETEPRGDSWSEEQEAYSENVEAEYGYGQMFEEAQAQWSARQSEKLEALSARLRELLSLPRHEAYDEWQHFLASEFLPNVELTEMEIFYEALYRNDLPPEVAKLIGVTMEKRRELYKYSMELEKASLADDIMGCVCFRVPPYEAERKPGRLKRILKRLAMGAAAAVILFVILAAVTAKDGVRDAKISGTILAYLNEKYPEEEFSEEKIQIESTRLYGEKAENIVSYQVMPKEGSYNVFAYLIGDKGGKNFTCFDNLQEAEIKQAFQDSINEKTGHPEGKLFWNSAGGAFDCVEDGYFHEKYEGDLDNFFHMETKARNGVSGGDYTSGSSVLTGKNGAADYYIPDMEVETIEQRLNILNYAEDTVLKDTLNQCALEYEMQLQGIVLPKNLFAERTKRIEWGDYGTYVVRTLDSPFIDPPVPFLMTTGWYVNVPSDAAEYLKIESGLYAQNLVQMADGIYGTKSGINNSVVDFSEMEGDLTGCMKVTETPESIDISEGKRKKAVSFSLAQGYGLTEDYCLAIEKEAYGISELGYRVMLTEYREDVGDVTEMKVYTYSDPLGHVEYGDVLDGEGYLFVEYPRPWNGEKPAVLTICPQ